MRAYRKPVDGLTELTTEYGTAGTLPEAFGRRSRKHKPCNVTHKQKNQSNKWRNLIMEFFNSAVGVLQTLVIALGAGLGIWGAINLMEGYGNDNPGAKSQGMKQLMAGGGVALIGVTLVPLLSGLFG